MAWSTDQIYSFLKFLLRKNQAASISATDYFYAWNSEQSSMHEDLLGKWQNRSNGKTGINIGLIQDETMLTKLAPFTISTTLTITGGFANWPTDLIYQMALLINGEKVTHFNKDERWAITGSVIDPPSIADNCYYYTEFASTTVGITGKYEFLPATVTTATLDYIAACTDIVWAYTLDGQGRQVYDSVDSVQPKWNQNTIVEITKRALKNMGVSFKDQDFTQFGQSNIVTGN